MGEPLVYDVDTARPCANGMQHQVAFVKWVADMLHARGKRIFGNVFEVAHRFHATTIDIFGSYVAYCLQDAEEPDPKQGKRTDAEADLRPLAARAAPATAAPAEDRRQDNRGCAALM